MSTSENVVYSYDPERSPAIRYRAVPSGCAGAAESLQEARVAYRADLAAALNLNRRELPPVVEHVEALVHGMWVRERIGAVHRDHSADRMLLQTVLAAGAAQQELRGFVDEAAAAGAAPVILLVEPDEPVAGVLDQMTAHDAVVMAYSDPDHELGWAAIYGRDARGTGELTDAACDDLLRCTPVRRLGWGSALRLAG